MDLIKKYYGSADEESEVDSDTEDFVGFVDNGLDERFACRRRSDFEAARLQMTAIDDAPETGNNDFDSDGSFF